MCPALAVGCSAAFSARLARLLGGKLVSRPLLVGRYPAFPRDFSFLDLIHGGKSAFFLLCHE
jgi:hypothetical protein